MNLRAQILLLSIFLLPSFLEARQSKDLYSLPPVVAVENRLPLWSASASLHIGYFPNAFNRGLAVGGALTKSVNTYLSWEIFNLNHITNKDTKLKKTLLSSGIDLTDEKLKKSLEYLKYTASTNLIYTPFYSKSVLFNKSLIRSETSFLLGAGVGGFEKSGSEAFISFGLLLRLFNNKNTAWKFGLRNHLYLQNKSSLVNAWAFTIGFSKGW